MPERDAVIAAFLARHGWGDAERRLLAADASFRSYDRLRRGAATAVLMNAPPPEAVQPFRRLDEWLRGLGYSAPEILAADEAAGLLLLEDLGDDTYTRVIAGGGDEAALYERATDLLIDLHGRPAAETVPGWLPPYDEALLLREISLFTEWYLPALRGTAPDPAETAAWQALWQPLLAEVVAGPRTLTLRDYHVDNIMWLPDRHGRAACGLLDFQDAVAGHPAYDLVSLLEDERRDIAPDLVAAMRARYAAARPELAGAEFERAFHILSAKRHAKNIGIFTRLCRRDGKPQYLAHIPRMWRLLEGGLAHPALAPVAAWLDERVQPADRIAPPAD